MYRFFRLANRVNTERLVQVANLSAQAIVTGYISYYSLKQQENDAPIPPQNLNLNKMAG